MRSPFLDGSAYPEPERLTLRAGLLRLDYQAGMLRYIRVGKHELVRGVYAAVRDHNWGTVPAVVHIEALDIGEDAFNIRFVSEHHQDDIHFVWRGTITGSAEGVISFGFDGEAHSTFRRNRIGFCVLHPADAAGAALELEHTDGSIERGVFPQRIAPHQPFFDIRSVTHTAAPGVRVQVRMEGDSFEMEDQRNWTDASFKTYCTPLAMPFPVTVRAGERIQQAITIRLLTQAVITDIADQSPQIAVDMRTTAALPKIGLGCASHREALTARQIERLRALHLSHLRVDLHLAAHDMETVLDQAWAETRAIGADALEIAAHLSTGGDPQAELNRLAARLSALTVTGAVIVLQDGALVTPDAIIQMAERILSPLKPAIMYGAGTNGYFTEINRFPPARTVPLVAYSLNPQVHAFDNASLIETLPIMGLTVQMTPGAAESGSRPLVAVTPVTLRIRWNPNATGEEREPQPGQLPHQVDARQMSLFGAGWTMGALASLALAQPYSVTFYETTGWLGVMEREAGSPLPERFPSLPDAVFPLYHVLADAGEYRGGWAVATRASHPLRVSALALRAHTGMRLLVANHTNDVQSVRLTGLPGGWAVRLMDEQTASFAMREPQAWRNAPADPLEAVDGTFELTLPPFALAHLVNLDFDAAEHLSAKA